MCVWVCGCVAELSEQMYVCMNVHVLIRQLLAWWVGLEERMRVQLYMTCILEFKKKFFFFLSQGLLQHPLALEWPQVPGVGWPSPGVWHTQHSFAGCWVTDPGFFSFFHLFFIFLTKEVELITD